MPDREAPMKVLRTVALTIAAVLWLGVCSILLVTGLLELLYPDELRYRNGVLVFYLGIRVVGFPLGTLAFYAVNLALSSGLSAITKLWVYWTSVLLVGGIQWLVLVPMIVRGLLKGRGKASLDLRS
jgi:hypothetical protein